MNNPNNRDNNYRAIYTENIPFDDNWIILTITSFTRRRHRKAIGHIYTHHKYIIHKLLGSKTQVSRDIDEVGSDRKGNN